MTGRFHMVHIHPGTRERITRRHFSAPKLPATFDMSVNTFPRETPKAAISAVVEYSLLLFLYHYVVCSCSIQPVHVHCRVQLQSSRLSPRVVPQTFSRFPLTLSSPLFPDQHAYFRLLPPLPPLGALSLHHDVTHFRQNYYLQLRAA